MNIVIFDSSVTGHHSEYIRHLVKYIIKQDNSNIYFFVVHPDLLTQFPDIKDLIIANENIKFCPILLQENIKLCASRNMVVRSFAEYKLMDNYARRFNADRSVLLHLNIFQFALAVFKPKYLISGILFKPFPLQAFDRNLVGKLNKLRKKLQTKFMIKNKRLDSVFLLNDESSCSFLNNKFDTDTFKYLPDPIPVYEAEANFDVRKFYGIPQEKLIYLHAGSLESRKGTLEIIKSLPLINKDVQKRIAIVIVGKAGMGFNYEIKDLIEKSNFETQVIYDNCYVSTARLKALFEQTNFILIPYKSAESSSGLLGHAVLNEKLVIGPNSGLLGNLILKFKIGIRIEAITEIEIGKAIEFLFFNSKNMHVDSILRREYLLNHTELEFARILFES